MVEGLGLASERIRICKLSLPSEDLYPTVAQSSAILDYRTLWG